MDDSFYSLPPCDQSPNTRGNTSRGIETETKLKSGQHSPERNASEQHEPRISQNSLTLKTKSPPEDVPSIMPVHDEHMKESSPSKSKSLSPVQRDHRTPIVRLEIMRRNSVHPNQGVSHPLSVITALFPFLPAH